MPKHKEFIKFYKSFANMYGVIPLKDAYDILFDFNVDFSIEDMIEDVKCRMDEVDEFFFYIDKKLGYLIVSHTFAGDEIGIKIMSDILSSQSMEPYFHPESLSSLLKYKDPYYYDRKLLFTKEMEKYLEVAIKGRDLNPYELVIQLNYMSKVGFNYDEVLEMMNEAFAFPSKPKEKKLFKEFFLLFDGNRRKWKNGGWTDLELMFIKLFEEKGLSYAIDGDLKNKILCGEVDIHSLIDTINSSDIPVIIKESILSEINDIQKQLDKNVA